VANLVPEHDAAGDATLVKVRHALGEDCMAILTAYRKFATSHQALPQSQLILPDKLQLLPLFIMSLRKSPMLRSSRGGDGLRSAMPSPRADERAWSIQRASQATPATAFWIVHPLLLDVTSNTFEWQRPGASLPDEANRLDHLKLAPYVELPDALRPTVSSMDEDKVYLLDTCFVLYVLIGKDVSPESVQQLQSVLHHTTTTHQDHPLARALTQLRVWSQVGKEPRWLRPLHAPVVLVHHGDAKYDQSVVKSMVCDAAFGDRSYVDFLVELHRRVRAKLEA
jgi:hypothetical protein